MTYKTGKCKDQEEVEERIESIKEILKEHEIEMNVGGCGCCGSPWVSFSYKGDVILDDECGANFATEGFEE